MENKTFVQKLDALQYDVTHFLCTEFHNMGSFREESKYVTCRVLKIEKENLQFSFHEGIYLREFDGNMLIDNRGCEWNLNSLSIDQLCILADAIKKREF